MATPSTRGGAFLFLPCLIDWSDARAIKDGPRLLGGQSLFALRLEVLTISRDAPQGQDGPGFVVLMSAR